MAKGIKMSEETKKKLSIARIKYYKDHVPWNTGRHLSLETKLKISQSEKGKTITEEHRRKLSKSLKGRAPWIKGKHHTNSSKSKISKALSGANNPRWKGGRRIRNGYVEILAKQHPHCGCEGYVSEHRLVIEKYLRRYLTRIECVHHLNNIKSDNKISNLVVFKDNSSHRKLNFDNLVFDGRVNS
ncbi:MAG: NUMOD3 domain-containing DNA-binding protein [Candidatus Omnitrophota bacterium]|jgi:hypothetical protein